jgi:hypothetical protein
MIGEVEIVNAMLVAEMLLKFWKETGSNVGDRVRTPVHVSLA